MRDRRQSERETAAGISRLEGYLLGQAEIQRAESQGKDFAGRLPWLTTAQQEEVARHYTQDRLATTRQALTAVNARQAELREEYTARYQTLRQQLLCRCVALLITALTLCCTTVLLVVLR
ncbi:hypothetical protein [Streptomyces candidus]|uniref:Uncharacterized protein n=1 Tax=Streptomyces candidus TaxID=67283 RepID=A0A7X0HLD2_9ACTN|nr:hypothetical protein [Streptomyces candidus]MBB6438532.1 hypothetical protein [Streptomyces candidus]GHH45556.1 hypothetical protein GCM10018773_35200 [Streptomyces candidus]